MINPNKYLMIASAVTTFFSFASAQKSAVEGMYKNVCAQIKHAFHQQIPKLMGASVKEALEMLDSPAKRQAHLLLKTPGVKEQLRDMQLDEDGLAALFKGDLTPFEDALVTQGCPPEIAACAIAAVTRDDEKLVASARALATKLDSPISDELAGALVRMMVLLARQQSGGSTVDATGPETKTVGDAAAAAWSAAMVDVLRSAKLSGVGDGLLKPLLGIVSGDTEWPAQIVELLVQHGVPQSLANLLRHAMQPDEAEDPISIVAELAEELVGEQDRLGNSDHPKIGDLIRGLLAIKQGHLDEMSAFAEKLANMLNIPSVMLTVSFAVVQAAAGSDGNGRMHELFDSLAKQLSDSKQKSLTPVLQALVSLSGACDDAIELAATASGVDARLAAYFDDALDGDADAAGVIIDRLIPSMPQVSNRMRELYAFTVAAEHFGKLKLPEEEQAMDHQSFVPGLPLLATALGLKPSDHASCV